MALQIGDLAPDFKIHASDKSEVILSSHRGKNIVLIFFPFAFTGVCTDELCSIRDTKTMYDDINAEIIAISVDSPFALGKFKELQSYNFTLASDFNKEVCTAYGTLYETFVLGLKGVSKRSAFVVDKEGIIRYAEILENAGELPNFDAINATLKELA